MATKKNVIINAAAKLAKFRKDIKAREEKFKRMSPENQRVTVAKDVLAQLDLKKITAKRGRWVETKLVIPEELTTKDAAGYDLTRDIELRDLLAIQDNSCSACALGAMFCAAVTVADDCKVRHAGTLTESDTSDKRMNFQAQEPAQYLQKFFKHDQLALIEQAFELGGGAYSDNSESEHADWFIAATIAAFRKYKTADSRMRAIMKNVAANDGTFRPDLDPNFSLKNINLFELSRGSSDY